MIKPRGSITARTFSVVGKPHDPLAPDFADRLKAFRFQGDARLREEGEASGWVTDEHILDVDFRTEKVVRGDFAVFALRIDKLRVPRDLLDALIRIEEDASRAALDLQKLPFEKRREIRRSVREKLVRETPAASRCYGIAWNVRARRLHLLATSEKVTETFADLFQRTFDREVVRRTPLLVAEDTVGEGPLAKALSQVEASAIGFVDEGD